MNETNSPAPGPWAIGVETNELDAQIIAADGQHVATVSVDPLIPTARLIAAAPELLACILDVLDADGDLYVMDFDRYRKAVAAATSQKE